MGREREPVDRRQQCCQRLMGSVVATHHEFARRPAQQLVAQPLEPVRTLELARPRSPCRRVDDRPAETLSLKDDRGQQRRGLLTDEALLVERARGVDAGHDPLQQLLPGPQFLFLLAQSDLVTRFEHPCQIGLHRVPWNPSHGNRIVGGFVAAGKGDSEDFGSEDGIVMEHLVEVAHAEEQHRVRVFLLDRMELFHHR